MKENKLDTITNLFDGSEIRVDIIENRHSGIPTMKREMKKYGLPEPEFYEERDSFKVIFRNNIVVQKGQQSDTQSGQQNTSLENYKNIVLEFCLGPKTAKEIKDLLKIKSRQYVSSNIIKPLISEGKLEYTNKNSINARNQKYVAKKD